MAPTFARGQDIDAYFTANTGHGFVDWFVSTQQHTGAWAEGHNPGLTRGDETKHNFTTIWDGIPAMFGTPTVTLVQFLSLMSIFVNEVGGRLVPITEGVGRSGHPGIAYAFDRIGRKASYNTGKNNRTALALFNDEAFIAAHGHRVLGAELARTQDPVWAGDAYPVDRYPTSTDPNVSGFILEADFYKFRGRGLIQTTWRNNYKDLIGFVVRYAGSDPTVASYARAWAGRDADEIATTSTNDDWNALFMRSNYEIAWAGIAAHNRDSDNYLAMSADADVLLGAGPGSIFRVGRVISGSEAYGVLVRRRVVQMLAALDEPIGGAAATGEPPSAAVTTPGPDGVTDVLAALIPGAGMLADSVDALFRALSGAGLAAVAIEQLIAAGVREVNRLTDIAFWIEHPDWAGQKIPSGRKDLAKAWLALRDELVEPALAAARRVETPPASPEASTPASADGAAFVADGARSTVELLPEPARSRWASFRWGWMDFPGKQVAIAGLSAAEQARYDADPEVTRTPDGKHFVGRHQAAASELLTALVAVRPGGGERRPNAGPHAVLTKAEFQRRPAEYDALIASALAGLRGQGTHRLHRDAAAAFDRMAADARGEGVDIKVLSSFRDRARAEANARASGNPKAVAAYSSHTLGLAIDVALWTPAVPGRAWNEVSTADFRDIVRMLQSPVHKWLFLHGAAYGFFAYRNEPWHWEYNPPGFATAFLAGAPERVG